MTSSLSSDGFTIVQPYSMSTFGKTNSALPPKPPTKKRVQKQNDSNAENTSLSTQLSMANARLWEVNRNLLRDLAEEREKNSRLEDELRVLKNRMDEISLDQSMSRNDPDFLRAPVPHLPNPLKLDMSSVEIEKLLDFALGELKRCRSEMTEMNRLLSKQKPPLSESDFPSPPPPLHVEEISWEEYKSLEKSQEAEKETIPQNQTSNDEQVPKPLPKSIPNVTSPVEENYASETLSKAPTSFTAASLSLETPSKDRVLFVESKDGLSEPRETPPERYLVEETGDNQETHRRRAISETDYEIEDYDMMGLDRRCPICGKDFPIFDCVTQAQFEAHADQCAEKVLMEEPTTIVAASNPDPRIQVAVQNVTAKIALHQELMENAISSASENNHWTCPVCFAEFALSTMNCHDFENHVRLHFR